jgi:hypothetical protein
MKEPISDEVFNTLPKKPNFLLVVVLAGATMLILFVAAFLLLSDTGKKLLPGLHPDPHPTSYLVMPASRAVDA